MSDDTVGARPDDGGAAPEPDEEVKADTADRAPGDYGAPALDLAGCAAVLDLAARESTVMSMTMTVRQRLGLGSRVPADVRTSSGQRRGPLSTTSASPCRAAGDVLRWSLVMTSPTAPTHLHLPRFLRRWFGHGRT